MSNKKPDIPIEKRPLLTIQEASAYFGINTAKLSKMLNEPNCTFVLRNGRKNLIKKDAFYEYLMNSTRI